MNVLKLEHFERAANDIGAHGDNDTLPFDMDTKFISEVGGELSKIAFEFATKIEAKDRKDAVKSLNAIQMFSERLLTPAGYSGFRITTKIHPFWNIYFNGLGIAVAEKHEAERSNRAHAYRFTRDGTALFDRSSSWRAFREASINDCSNADSGSVVVQTDVSSFYDHIYHHRLENFLGDLFPASSNVHIQIDRMLSKFSGGRSFGIPVGGQCSRIVAEVLMTSIDKRLSAEGISWRRYVDDFVLIADSQSRAYQVLAILSNALADYGLTLNRTKTSVLNTNHYIDYVQAQLGAPDEDSNRLKEIDLYFDPYSDTAESDYEELRGTIEQLDIGRLLGRELEKGQPDNFVVVQISRTLRLMEPTQALDLCSTLLAPNNLHAFRGSWSSVMRGISSIRADDSCQKIFSSLDKLIDDVPEHSNHLLSTDVSCLHYLRTLRFRRTEPRASFVLSLYKRNSTVTVKRACIDCWRSWGDRDRFIALRNGWQSCNSEEQRMIWLSASMFGDDGKHFRQQVRTSLEGVWALGIEKKQGASFSELYAKWAENV